MTYLGLLARLDLGKDASMLSRCLGIPAVHKVPEETKESPSQKQVGTLLCATAAAAGLTLGGADCGRYRLAPCW